MSGGCAPTLYSQTDGTDSTTAPFGGKWEPQAGFSHDHDHDHDYDHNCNCHANHIHRGSISGGTKLEAAHKLDPVLGMDGGSTNYDPHSTDIGSKVDPRVGSDVEYRGLGATSQTGRNGTFTRRDTEPLIRTSNALEGEAQTGHSHESDDELDRHVRQSSMSKDSPGKLIKYCSKNVLVYIDKF